MALSSIKPRELDPGRNLEVLHAHDDADYLPPPDFLGDVEPRHAADVAANDMPDGLASAAIGPEVRVGDRPRVAHRHQQVAPFMDLYAPTWLHPLIKLLVLDEHGPMPRTVQAQAGFGVLLMSVQFCMDMLAWTLGFRWVFVNAMGPIGWVLAVLFAFLISLVIIIFERFVLTADVYATKVPLFLNPAILMRVAVVVLFAAITSIPVEMLVFHDVIQGRLNGELQGVREAARQQLRGDIHKDVEDVAAEEGKSRTRLKEETPPVKLEALEVPQHDTRLGELDKQYGLVIAELTQEEKGWRSGRKGRGPKWFRLNDEKAALERQLGEAKAGRQAEVDRRTEANRKAEDASAKRHYDELSKISDRYEPRKRDLEKKLRDVDRMPDQELKTATKREFAVVDGFARRWKIMNDLEKEEPLFNLTKNAVRGLFIAFGLLVLTTKALFNRPTRAYYAGLDPLKVNDASAASGRGPAQPRNPETP